MRKDPTEFRKRFAAWRDGKKPYENGRISDELYVETMEKVARDNWQQWGDESEDASLTRILNDNSYDYRGYYNKYPKGVGNAQNHWTDEFKTVWHPSFSIESKYSGKKSQYNPYGYPGGTWQGEFFTPLWYQQNPNAPGFYKDGYPRIPKYKDGKQPYKAGLPVYEDGKYVQAGKDNSWSRISDNDVSDTFQEIIARPSHRGGNTTVGNWNRQWSLKGEPGLEIVSPEFDLLALLSPVRINPISYRQYKAERQISNSFNKGIKENSILNSYNSVPSNKDIGTAYEYLDFLDNVFPNSKLNQVFYHGGPKGISKFKSAKQLGSTNKNIISGTKDYGIYFADDLDLAKYYKSSHKKDGLLYTVRVNVEKPIEYNTNNWYLDKFKGTLDLRFSPGTVTEKWYDKLNLKNYDGIYHRHSTNAFDNGELVMFDPDNIHIMGTPLETNMFYKWKQNPIYSKKQLELIPIMPEQYDKTFKNYMKAIKPGAVIGSLLGAPVGLSFYEVFKHKLKNNNIKVNDDQNSFRNDSIDRSLY